MAQRLVVDRRFQDRGKKRRCRLYCVLRSASDDDPLSAARYSRTFMARLTRGCAWTRGRRPAIASRLTHASSISVRPAPDGNAHSGLQNKQAVARAPQHLQRKGPAERGNERVTILGQHQTFHPRRTVSQPSFVSRSLSRIAVSEVRPNDAGRCRHSPARTFSLRLNSSVCRGLLPAHNAVPGSSGKIARGS
jgi:hypothetical protein